MAFKGVSQRWRKMRAKNLIALKSLFVGGAEDKNKVSGFIRETITEDSSDWTIVAGVHDSREEDVSGAELGDQVLVALNKDHDGLIVDGYVNDEDKVTVVAVNESGSSVTISQPFDINILVIK